MSTIYYGQPVNVGSTKNLAAQTAGTQVKSGEGSLYSLTFNKPVATSVITIYDGTDTNGTKIATITTPASPMPVTLTYNTYFTTGLFVVIATADCDLTITYK